MTSDFLTFPCSNIPSFKFGIDSSGNYGYIKDGADSVTPFKNGATILNLGNVNSANIKTLYPGIYQDLTVDNFIVSITGGSTVYVPWQYNGNAASINAFEISKSYDNTTGILSVGGCGDSIGLYNNGHAIQYAPRTFSKYVYLIY